MLSSVTQFRVAWVPSWHPGRALCMGGEACVKLGVLQVPRGQMAGSPAGGGRQRQDVKKSPRRGVQSTIFQTCCVTLGRSLHISEPRFLPTPTTLQGCGEAPGRQSMYENTRHTGRKGGLLQTPQHPGWGCVCAGAALPLWPACSRTAPHGSLECARHRGEAGKEYSDAGGTPSPDHLCTIQGNKPGARARFRLNHSARRSLADRQPVCCRVSGVRDSAHL